VNKVSLVKYLCALGCATGFLMNSALAESTGGRLDVTFAYNVAKANIVSGTGFTLQGGTLQVQDRFWRGLGVVADVSGLHAGATPNSSAGLNLVSATFGPRYTWFPGQARVKIFGEALGGEAWGSSSMFPGAGGVVPDSSSSALEIGGGLDLMVSTRVGVRALQADWLRTALPNATTNVQNNLRLGFGLTLRIK
jgi:hypothetical protein